MAWRISWWDVLFRGLIAIAFGLILFFLPGLSLLTFVMLFAVLALVDGILMLLQMVSIKDGRWWARLIHGILGIGAAMAVVIWPSLSLLVFTYIIAFYWLVTGIMQVVVGIEARKAITGELLLITGGILSLIIGALLMVHPLAGIVALAQVVGIFSLAFGVIMVLLAIGLKLSPAKAPITT